MKIEMERKLRKMRNEFKIGKNDDRIEILERELTAKKGDILGLEKQIQILKSTTVFSMFRNSFENE